jgi:hypothetical protein
MEKFLFERVIVFRRKSLCHKRYGHQYAAVEKKQGPEGAKRWTFAGNSL